ncbi:hypothetical protein [Vibrio sp. 1F279]|uniref:hypothetical protein n=1 Tax=unclassified Vibrio TaxID=2614977 RepID=UPI00352CA66C
MTDYKKSEKLEQSSIRDTHLQSLTLLVPARRFVVDFDVTEKSPLPAILESALMLLAQLEQVSPGEIADFFGLDPTETKCLINDICNTELAKINENGLLVPTSRMISLRKNKEFLELEKVINYNQAFLVDELTQHIQPKMKYCSTRGLPEVHAFEGSESYEGRDLFSNQFIRFQQCSRLTELKRMSTRLYKVNRCYQDQVCTYPLSINVMAHIDSYQEIRLSTKLTGVDVHGKQLVNSSGLQGCINEFLDRRSESAQNLLLEEYCQRVNDPVLLGYDEGSHINIKQLLLDKKSHNFDYSDEETKMILGPMYLDNNNKKIMNLFKGLKQGQKISEAVWLPAKSETWAGCTRFDSFVAQLGKLLQAHESELHVLVPLKERQDRQRYVNSLRGRLNSVIGYERSPHLNEMELLIVPGDGGFAIVQYHARLDSSLGMSGLTLPVGYVTTNPIRVTSLWDELTRDIKHYGDVRSVIGDKAEHLDSVLRHFSSYNSN